MPENRGNTSVVGSSAASRANSSNAEQAGSAGEPNSVASGGASAGNADFAAPPSFEEKTAVSGWRSERKVETAEARLLV